MKNTEVLDLAGLGFLALGMVGIGLDWKCCCCAVFGRQWSLAHTWLLTDVALSTFAIWCARRPSADREAQARVNSLGQTSLS